jgi:predicted type IV restriction endonuclease
MTVPAPDPARLIPTIETLSGHIANYSSRPGRVNESNTIRALITPMISALGWNIADLDEVQSEYRHKSSDNPVDYALFLEGAPALFIEAKALDEKLDDRKWIVQTLNYANACNVEWAVLTNGAEWRVYNVHAKAEAEDKLFYTAHVDGPDQVETARRLAMLSKEGMAPKHALDQLWREASVDRAMRDVIETLPENRGAIRAMAKASNGLTEKDVREALRRLGLRADWRDEDDLFPNHMKAPESAIEVASVPTPKIVAHQKEAPAATQPEKQRRKRYTTYDGEWPAEATHVIHWSDCLAFGVFDQETQEMRLLPGAKCVRERRVEIMPAGIRSLQDEMIADGRMIDDGQYLTASEGLPGGSPSSSASFVSTGSANGWHEWIGRDGKRLEHLRKA